MPITLTNHTSYGPPLVTDKYTPLDQIEWVDTDKPIYSGLLRNRANLLRSLNILPQPLTLVTPGWANIVAAEAGHRPPLVVISSNRSKWIKEGIDNAQAKLQSLQLRAFDNVWDLRALEGIQGQAQAVSPPIYCPVRLGPAPNRNVYIVVQASEYGTYRRSLANTGITVVGWEFKLSPRRSRDHPWLAGFGASRFAAITFCQHLRAAATVNRVAPWSLAWLVDDNVVGLTACPDLAAVEAAMGNNDVCASFRGGTEAEPRSKNQGWAERELAAPQERGKPRRGREAQPLGKSEPPGIVQQMSLWNLAYLDANQLTFGPAFVASAEDLSLTKYFDSKKIPYYFYKGVSIYKENTTYDNGNAAEKVNAARNQLAKWFADAEAAATPQGQQPPPPVMVVPRTPPNAPPAAPVNLSNFVINTVLPNANDVIKAKRNDATTQNNARCQAVEQLTANAIEHKLVDDSALDSTFKINLNAAQAINTRDRPW